VIRCRGLLALVGLIFMSVVVAAPVPAAAAESDLLLIAQNFNIAADGTLAVTVALPEALLGTDMSRTVFAVTVAERVDKREDLVPIISGELSRPDDTVAISPACCAGPAAGQFTLSVPLETSEISPNALSIPRRGLYPVTIELQRDGRIVSTLLTFINRLPAAGDDVSDPDPLSVAVAIGTKSTVHLDSEGTTSVDSASTIAEMTSLADTLDALGASKFPATVRIQPAVLAALQILDPTLFARLTASLQAHQVVVEPQWPIDPSSASSAGQTSLYTSWLRAGQDRLAGLGLGPSVTTTSTIIVDQPIGADGATLRRNLGAGLMVTTHAVYDELEGSIKRYSDYKGELIPADLPNNTTLDVAVVDKIISDMVAQPLASPELTRIYAVAGLLALRQGIEIAGEDPGKRAVVLGMPDLGVPDAGAIGPIVSLIAETPGLTAATLDDVGFRTDRLLIEGDERPVTLPAITVDDVAKRVFTQATLDGEIDSIASMLPADSERPKGWRDLADLLPTNALDDADAQSMVSTVRSQLADVQNAVQVPGAYTVNLPGRRSTVRVRFVNNSDVPLSIKVRLSSPSGKLVFSNDPLPVTLEPGVPKEVAIPVEARSNGTSGVSLDVFTPNDVQIGTTVPLKFRVNALGVGNVLTIALFGVVLLWWLQHIRSARRKRRQAQPATLPDL
jgi:Family of unknown function (DUF6049)